MIDTYLTEPKAGQDTLPKRDVEPWNLKSVPWVVQLVQTWKWWMGSWSEVHKVPTYGVTYIELGRQVRR